MTEMVLTDAGSKQQRWREQVDLARDLADHAFCEIHVENPTDLSIARARARIELANLILRLAETGR